jgi:hypothetical protein
VSLDDREDLLGTGGALTVQDAPADLIDLALAMGDVFIQLRQEGVGQVVADVQQAARVSRTRASTCAASAK